MKRFSVLIFLFCFICTAAETGLAQSDVLLNVSYDPTREFYQEINRAFIKQWKQKNGKSVTIRQSHGGAGKQARSVIDGLEADVITLALAYDINAISRMTGLLPKDWQTRLPFNSCPYTSTIVFLVRKGNPKDISDWNDLIKEGVEVITPNPKTSGGARWNYLAAWAFASRKFEGDETKVKEFMNRLYRNVPVLDTGARGSTTTFVQRGIGDILLAWENEALLALNKLQKGNFEIVVPSISILAEPPVAWVDKNVRKHGTEALAKAYLSFLYSDYAQEAAGRHYYRPRKPEILRRFTDQFPRVEMVNINEAFGGWEAAQTRHFNEGGLFDRIYQPEK